MELIPRKDYFDDLFDLDSMMFDRTPSMKCDIYEEDNKYHIEMDVPGFKRENIKVNFDNNYLTITAKNESKEDNSNKKYIRKERNYQKISRRFYLDDVDENSIEASFKDGILHIVVAKKEKNKDKKYIEIK